jgi:hypothetical protein
MLQIEPFIAATNCSETQRAETSLYARCTHSSSAVPTTLASKRIRLERERPRSGLIIA